MNKIIPQYRGPVGLFKVLRQYQVRGNHRDRHENNTKLFTSQETTLARAIMSRNNGYMLWPRNHRELIDKLRLTSKHSSSIYIQIIANFQATYESTQNREIDANFGALISAMQKIVQNCSKFSDEEVLEAVQVLANVHTKSVTPVSRELDLLRDTLSEVCTIKCSGWDIEMLLYVCDMWCLTTFGNRTKFANAACTKLANVVDKMTVKQMVQALFYLSWHRKVMATPFEMPMRQRANELSLSELSIAALGLFRTRTIVASDEVILNMYQRLLKDDWTDLQDLSLVAFIKLFRLSARPNHRRYNMRLLHKLAPNIAAYSFVTCTHISLVAAASHNCHTALMEAIANRSIEQIETLRLKDMERICYAFVKLNYRSPARTDERLFQAILAELPRRPVELTRFPRVFANCTRYLAYRNMPCAHLIERILERQFLDTTYESSEKYDEEVLFLDSYAKMALKDVYKGPHLSDTQRHDIAMNFCTHKMNRFEMDVFEMISFAYKAPTWIHALPHFSKPDMFLAMDPKQRQALDISTDDITPKLGQIISKDMLIPMGEQLHVIVVIIESVMQKVRTDNGIIKRTGHSEFRINQLQQLGFIPMRVDHAEWQMAQDKQQYIRNKMNACLKNRFNG